jgi:hypothetical protein
MLTVGNMVLLCRCNVAKTQHLRSLDVWPLRFVSIDEWPVAELFWTGDRCSKNAVFSRVKMGSAVFC